MTPSRLVGTLLSPALRLWLRSQAEHVDTLTVHVEGSDRQILGGTIPGVSLSATGVIYQGLHLRQLEMRAAAIRINIGQVVRGKPLELMAPIPVKMTVVLAAETLNHSTSSPLLTDALVDLWQMLVEQAPELLEGRAIAHPPQPSLQFGEDYLETQIRTHPGENFQDRSMEPHLVFDTDRLAIRTQLDIVDGHILQLRQPCRLIADAKQSVPMQSLEGVQLDLGPDVDLHTLAIAPEELTCSGQLMVMP